MDEQIEEWKDSNSKDTRVEAVHTREACDVLCSFLSKKFH